MISSETDQQQRIISYAGEKEMQKVEAEKNALLEKAYPHVLENLGKINPKKVNCVDGRGTKDTNENGMCRPGSFLGLALASLAHRSELGLSVSEVFSATKAFADSKGMKMEWHTDDHAHGPACAGCGHMMKARAYADSYKVQEADVLELFALLDAEPPENGDVLLGGHMEQGAVVVSGRDYTLTPGGTEAGQFFVYNAELDGILTNELQAWLEKTSGKDLAPNALSTTVQTQNGLTFGFLAEGKRLIFLEVKPLSDESKADIEAGKAKPKTMDDSTEVAVYLTVGDAIAGPVLTSDKDKATFAQAKAQTQAGH